MVERLSHTDDLQQQGPQQHVPDTISMSDWESWDLDELMQLYEELTADETVVLSVDEAVISEVVETSNPHLDEYASAAQARFTGRASNILVNIGSMAGIVTNLQPFFQTCLHCVTGVGAVASSAGSVGGNIMGGQWNGLLNARANRGAVARPTKTHTGGQGAYANGNSSGLRSASSLWEFLNPSQTIGLAGLFQAPHSIGFQQVLLELFAA